jgi:hypothetical protein
VAAFNAVQVAQVPCHDGMRKVTTGRPDVWDNRLAANNGVHTNDLQLSTRCLEPLTDMRAFQTLTLSAGLCVTLAGSAAAQNDPSAQRPVRAIYVERG